MCPASEAGNVDSYNSLRPVPAIGLSRARRSRASARISC